MGFEETKNNSEASSSSHVLHLPRESTPLLNSKTPHQSSQFKTFANVFIAIVGAGVLGLPYTFKRTGYVTGTLTVFAVAYFTNPVGRWEGWPSVGQPVSNFFFKVRVSTETRSAGLEAEIKRADR